MSSLGNNLALRNFSLTSTSGGITVNDPITWSTDNTLTLSAASNLNINNAITATGTNAGLVMNYGGDYNILTPASFSGAVLNSAGIPVAQTDTSGGVYGSATLSGSNASLTMNGTAYTLIHDLATYATTGTLSGNYALAQNIDATAWSAANTGTPSVYANFSGTFAGLGHTIGNLTLNAPSSWYVGLIGQISGPVTIRDIGLTNANITGSNFVGALVGRASNATVSQAYVEQSSVTGVSQVGGLLGGAWTSTIKSSYADVSITGAQPNPPPVANVGGLIGYLMSGSTVINSHASAVIGSSYNMQAVGGLIGFMGYGNTVTNSYATGNVTGYDEIGGLIGSQVPGTADSVTNSFATGAVTGATQVGGLIGSARLDERQQLLCHGQCDVNLEYRRSQ